MFLELLAELLEADGRFAVVGRAANGREAVELAGRVPVDVVVMDIDLPVLDGVEATRLIQELRPGLPVVAISGHDYEERVLDIRSAGAADYVRKSRIEEELPTRSPTSPRSVRRRRPTEAGKSRRWDSNPRPIPYKGIALPAELLRRAARSVPRRRYWRTSRPFWCVMILRFTRCRALSIVFVSHSSRSAISS